jgi:voltage-gated sodium channel
MASRCKRVADSSLFQNFILGVIVLNAVTLGVQTYDLKQGVEDALNLMDDFFLGIFLIELTIRIAAFGSRPQDFFKDGWNLFDFIVIGAVFVPGIRENATLLRIVRLLRVVRVVTVLPDLRVLIQALVRSIPPILSLGVLTLMLMYVYGMVGWILFHEQDPENWGDIGTALLSTFTMLTLENWPTLLDAGMAIHPQSWVFFVSYVLLASFLDINILIANIINSVEQVHQSEREDERAERLERLEEGDMDSVTVADRLTALRDALDELELDLQSGATVGPAAPTPKRPSKGGRMRG